MQYCQCNAKPPKIREAVKEFLDEFLEFLRGPSLDEASDCAYAVGRVLAAMVGKVYVRVPGDGRHIAKIDRRMADYGCIRSKKHLKAGRCPSE